MSSSVLNAISTLVRLRRIELSPGWSDSALGLDRSDERALDAYCEALGWAPSSHYEDNPRAHEFPLLAYHPDHGWGVAERFESDDRLSVHHDDRIVTWTDIASVRLFDVVIPIPAGTKDFQKSIDVFKAAIYRRKHVIILATLATLVVNLIALVTSLYSMQVYDRVVPRGAFSTLWVLSAGAIVALLFDLVLRIIRANLLESEAAKIDTEVSEFFFSRSNAIRLDARPMSIGTTAAQLRGLDQIRAMISSTLIFSLADLPFAVLFMVVIFALGGVIATVLLIAFPIAIATAFVFARLIRDDTARAQVSGNKKNGLLVEALDAAETVKANRGQWFLLSRWNALLDEVHASELPVRNRQAFAGSVFGVMQQISYVCIIAWGAVEVFANNISMGALIACSILAGRVNGPLIGQLPGMLVQWSYSRSSLQLLDGILALPMDRPSDVDQLRPTRLAGALQLKDVAFAYSGGQVGVVVPQLNIAAGERIGIIGGIGSGKSTLLKLLAGLYAPGQGKILLDKLDMAQVSEDVLRRHIGYLPQDYRLINASLRENLLLGLADPGDDALLACAQKTGLANMINSHPRGLDLPISEGGRGLSGGQRVLTGLTRLMLAQPKLLLLDEPTANLDVDTETQLLRALFEGMSPDTTMVLVTHKLQLLGLVKRVIVVANGQIVLDGPTNDVMARLRAVPASQPAAKPAAGAAAPVIQGANA